jgi:outer membrane protein OmpA-like peptidoglycan-associated protein
MTFLQRLFSAVALAILLVGCGTTLAPKELLDARDAYDKAAKGPAAKLTPAQLDTAKQALDKAEQSFRDDGDGDVTKNLSYLAMRKAQIAAAQGDAAAAAQQKEQAGRELATLQSADAERTKKNLAKTKAQLEKEREDAKRQKEKSAEDIAREKQEVAKTKEQLAQEKAARVEAEKKLSAAMASLSEIAKVKEEKRGVVITLSGEVLFASGKYELLPIAQSKLDDVAKALKDQGFKHILVEGHTDSRGSAAKNDELSQRRADAVRSYLVSRGIPSDKIEARGIGSSRPIATNSTAEGRANNRRVELVVTPE